MEPITWILGAILLISGGGNYFQAVKVHKQAKAIHNVSTELQTQKDELVKRDKALVTAEISNRKRRARYNEALQVSGFIIDSQARQLRARTPDEHHTKHAKTTRNFSNELGKPDKLPSDLQVWKDQVLNSTALQLHAAKVEKEQSQKEMEALRTQLRELQKVQFDTLDELDEKSSALVTLTGEKAGLLGQLSSYSTYALWGGILVGLITLWGWAKGFYHKNVRSRYQKAMEHFSMMDEEGNTTAAEILQDFKLDLPLQLKKAMRGVSKV